MKRLRIRGQPISRSNFKQKKIPNPNSNLNNQMVVKKENEKWTPSSTNQQIKSKESHRNGGTGI